MKRPKTFSIVTFGCRTNQAESRLIGEKLTNITMQPYNNVAMADIVVVNTCAVTVKAEKEVRQTIRKIKWENPKCFLVVTGCWTDNIKYQKSPASPSACRGRTNIKNTPNKFLRNFTGQANQKLKILEKIDLLVGNEDKEKMGEILRKRFKGLRGLRGERGHEDKYFRSKKALVKIQDGCDNFCTYCVVPYLRGRSRSRPAEEIVREINQLVKRGIREVVLTGVDIASYKFKIQNAKIKMTMQKSKLNNFKDDLVKLLDLILRETKIEKISFGSINLQAFTPEFINFLSDAARDRFSESSPRDSVIGTSHKVMGPIANISSKGHFASPKRKLSTHFHIPLQSGCDATLKRMGRKYKISPASPRRSRGRANFKFLISKLKKKIPNFTFSTDIIVGFPGETDEEFEESLRGIREIREMLGKNFRKIHVFRYSPRPGTVACKMSTFAKAPADKLGKKGWERVSEKVKRKRAKQVASILGS